MRETETVESPEHLELESACQEKDRAAISKLIEAIPADRWTVIPERATCLSGPLTQVRHERGHRWPKWFRISSGYRRICTTFVLKSKMFWQADSELPEQRFLISCWLGNPPQPDLAAIGGGQDDVGALQRG